MVSKARKAFQRPQAAVLAARLREPRRFIKAVAGPRQTGKTALVQQTTAGLEATVRYASADEPGLRGADWIAAVGDGAPVHRRRCGCRAVP